MLLSKSSIRDGFRKTYSLMFRKRQLFVGDGEQHMVVDPRQHLALGRATNMRQYVMLTEHLCCCTFSLRGMSEVIVE